ncbi:MAG: CPBP family intramembrane glutamic endopeptidase [Thermoplasmatales archaeon]
MKIKQVSLITSFSAFFISEYLFITLNLSALYYVGVTAGLLSVPVAAIFMKKEMKEDSKLFIPTFAILLVVLFSLTVFFYISDRSWAVTLPELLITPVFLEEFNFRYVIQRLLLRRLKMHSSLLIQAVIYVTYYSRYVTADHGAGFPFPYNMLMLTSVFGMALVYGLIAMKTRCFLASTILHFIIWGLFPILALFPALASSLVPT